MTMSRAVVNQITNECCDNIGDMLDALDVKYTQSHRRIFGPCPIHGGDNPVAWNLYPEGDVVRGIWCCYTKNCQEKWKKTLVGFVHGVLAAKGHSLQSWRDAVKWMAEFLGYKDIADVKTPDAGTLERQGFNNVMRRLSIKPNTHVERTWQPTSYRKAVQIPSQYYIDRGYSADILRKYDVGYASRTNRSVVPIYDDVHKTIVGMTARTHWPQCPLCQYYHEPNAKCPTTTGDQINSCKWKHSPGFEASNYLYNFWFAKPHIESTGTIILVEGPGDVWRLEEAGIKNSVAIFGTTLNEEQLVLLESSWAMNAVVLTDNDKGGQLAAIDIKKN